MTNLLLSVDKKSIRQSTAKRVQDLQHGPVQHGVEQGEQSNHKKLIGSLRQLHRFRELSTHTTKWSSSANFAPKYLFANKPKQLQDFQEHRRREAQTL